MDGRRERGGGGGARRLLKQKVVRHILHDDDPYPLTLLSLSLLLACQISAFFFFHFFHIQNLAKFNTHKIRQKVFFSFFSHFPPTYLPTYPLACHGWFSSSPHYLLQRRYPSVLGMEVGTRNLSLSLSHWDAASLVSFLLCSLFFFFFLPNWSGWGKYPPQNCATTLLLSCCCKTSHLSLSLSLCLMLSCFPFFFLNCQDQLFL